MPVSSRPSQGPATGTVRTASRVLRRAGPRFLPSCGKQVERNLYFSSSAVSPRPVMFLRNCRGVTARRETCVCQVSVSSSSLPRTETCLLFFSSYFYLKGRKHLNVALWGLCLAVTWPPSRVRVEESGKWDQKSTPPPERHPPGKPESRARDHGPPENRGPEPPYQ